MKRQAKGTSNFQKALNLKNMKEALVNYSGTQDELYKIWHMFHEMEVLGFISPNLWERFYDETAGWVIEGDKVIDGRNGDKVIYEYSLGESYRA